MTATTPPVGAPDLQGWNDFVQHWMGEFGVVLSKDAYLAMLAAPNFPQSVSLPEAARHTLEETANKLVTYTSIYTGDKQAKRLISELRELVAMLAAAPLPQQQADADPIGDLQAEARQAKLDEFVASMKPQADYRSALINVQKALLFYCNDGTINDTLWMPVEISMNETLLDYIEGALEGGGDPGEQLTLPEVALPHQGEGCMDSAADIALPEGYCRDPIGAIIPPAGKVEDFSFGYNLGYADGLVAIKDSVKAIEERVLARLARTAAPVQDERVAFEHHERASELTRNPDGSPDDYVNPCVQSSWDGWQARAALAAQIQPAAPLEARPIPRVLGVSRDAESPGQKGVLVSFERQLTDDELRAFHDGLAGRAQAVQPIPTDLSKRLRSVGKCTHGYAQASLGDILAAADEIDRYYGGMVNWKAAEAKDQAVLNVRLPKLSEELYEKYPAMSAAYHERLVQNYALKCLAKKGQP